MESAQSNESMSPDRPRSLKDNYIIQAWLILILALAFGASLAGVHLTLSSTIETNKINETREKVPELVLGEAKARKLTEQNQALTIEPETIGVEKKGKKSTPDGASDEMRAVVFADTDLFSDAYIGFRIGLMGRPGNYQLLADSLKWLLGEGRVSGISRTEEDIKIVHSRDEDVLWFYATVFAVPLIILSIGVAARWGRGRRRKGR